MGSKINLNSQIDKCSYCNGTGVLRAMQSAINSQGVSVRDGDKIIKCHYCDGTGIKIKQS